MSDRPRFTVGDGFRLAFGVFLFQVVLLLVVVGSLMALGYLPELVARMDLPR